ncbi:nucleotidyltransferase family protein [Tsukamurella soli]|uniref:Polymerase nucleotidyl transferase domain-containing protein n=1 Tax=Tsukamurella soli TaxID=644556 RepID=A0ABP8JRA7_9ACTN
MSDTALAPSPDSGRLRALLAEHATAVEALLAKRGAVRARLFGSLAAGTAGPDSDIDLLVDFPEHPYLPCRATG